MQNIDVPNHSGLYYINYYTGDLELYMCCIIAQSGASSGSLSDDSPPVSCFYFMSTL